MTAAAPPAIIHRAARTCLSLAAGSSTHKFQPGGGAGHEGSGCQPGGGVQPCGAEGQPGGGLSRVAIMTFLSGGSPPLCGCLICLAVSAAALPSGQCRCQEWKCEPSEPTCR